MTSLRLLSFFDNKIRLPPPESLVKLTSLERLYLQKNVFRGSINYLCPLRNSLEEFRTDCGVRSGLFCECCTACGYNPNTAKGSMAFPASSLQNWNNADYVWSMLHHKTFARNSVYQCCSKIKLNQGSVKFLMPSLLISEYMDYAGFPNLSILPEPITRHYQESSNFKC